MVYDVTRRSTFNHLSSWLTDARNLTNPNTVIVLIGNKADLEDQRDVTYDEAKLFAGQNGLLFLETSAKTGDNVEESFLSTARTIYQHVQVGFFCISYLLEVYLFISSNGDCRGQDGVLDLNAADVGVQQKEKSVSLSDAQQPTGTGNCAC